jgi:hypothetical protein
MEMEMEIAQAFRPLRSSSFLYNSGEQAAA